MDLPAIETLRCFVETARSLSFRAAARRVALTPAAVGQRVRQLEAQVGSRLFERTTRRMALTEPGRALLPHAHAALDAVALAVRAARGETSPLPAEVTLGTRHELGMSWIVPMLPSLHRSHPEMTVHLYVGSGPDLLIRLRTQEVDCAVGSMRVTDPAIAAESLHRESYALVGSPALLRLRPLRRPADARAHTLLDVDADLPLFSYWRDAPGGGDRLPFGRRLRLGTIAAIRALVLAGEGVAVLPTYLVAPDLRAGRLRPILPGVRLLHDHFRLFFRAGDSRRTLFASLAATMRRHPLR